MTSNQNKVSSSRPPPREHKRKKSGQHNSTRYSRPHKHSHDRVRDWLDSQTDSRDTSTWRYKWLQEQINTTRDKIENVEYSLKTRTVNLTKKYKKMDDAWVAGSAYLSYLKMVEDAGKARGFYAQPESVVDQWTKVRDLVIRNTRRKRDEDLAAQTASEGLYNNEYEAGNSSHPGYHGGQYDGSYRGQDHHVILGTYQGDPGQVHYKSEIVHGDDRIRFEAEELRRDQEHQRTWADKTRAWDHDRSRRQQSWSQDEVHVPATGYFRGYYPDRSRNPQATYY